MSEKQVRAIVRGRVQGVFFRKSTLEAATRLGLCGTVRNLPDRSVEIIVRGPHDLVEQLLAWARQGPPSARVDAVETTPLELDPTLGTFRIRD